MKCVLVSNKTWQIEMFKKLFQNGETDWHFINSQDDFTAAALNEIHPDKIFITHWSHKIDETIYSNFNCILFHMTDLPYGRGGSPLQNLIIRGHTETKISAIKVVESLDAGEVYLKKPLKLNGSARQIFVTAAEVIGEMILEIIKTNPKAKPQTGDVVVFKRRKPEDGNLEKIESINQFYDYIRMLDADGYPNAFLETEHFKIEFSEANLNNDKTILAYVRIIKK